MPVGHGMARGEEQNGGRRTRAWLRRTVLLHDLQELDDDLGGGADQDLALAGLLGVVDVLESIVENRSADHLGGVVVVIVQEILKSGGR